MYSASGPQMNLTSSLLRGWSLCYNNTYNIQLNGLPLANILNQCNRSKLLIGCGSIYTPNIYYDLSHSHVANGVKWYFSNSLSMGFASETDSISGGWCDTETTNPSHRLCWHTVSGYDGYRCGSTIFDLSVDPLVWQRVVLYTD